MVLQAAKQREGTPAGRGAAESVRTPAANDGGGRKTEAARGRDVRGGDAGVGDLDDNLDVDWAIANIGESVWCGDGAYYNHRGGSNGQYGEYRLDWRSSGRSLADNGRRSDVDSARRSECVAGDGFDCLRSV